MTERTIGKDYNDAIFRRILDDPEFSEAIKDFYGTKIYRQAQKHDGQAGEPTEPVIDL